MNDFRKYATRHLGMNGMVLDDVMKAQAQYLNPYILEERQLNVTQMDVFSRLMMDRIIFLGTQIDDYTANTLQAQLLYLDSVDPGKDISIYINSPGGSVTAGLGIYDTILIKGVNADETNIAATAQFIAGLKDTHIKELKMHLLPYHDIGKDKHRRRGTVYNPDHILMEPPTDEEISQCRSSFERLGIKVVIGG